MLDTGRWLILGTGDAFRGSGICLSLSRARISSESCAGEVAPCGAVHQGLTGVLCDSGTLRCSSMVFVSGGHPVHDGAGRVLRRNGESDREGLLW